MRDVFRSVSFNIKKTVGLNSSLPYVIAWEGEFESGLTVNRDKVHVFSIAEDLRVR